MFKNILIGADPEVFVMDQGGQFISGHLFPCGTKEKPRIVTNGAVQVDGMALEFNVHPSKTRVEFVNNVFKVFKDLNDIVDQEMEGCTLVAIPTAEFGEDYIDSMPEMVKALGCNPDFNAYTLQANPVPDASMPFRTGSGHVHVGFTHNADIESMSHMLDCSVIASQLDFYVGLPSLEWDPDAKRRFLYGKAGAFRPKPYGMEYRTLSNRWVDDENLAGFVYDRTIKAIDDLNKGEDMEAMYPGLARKIIDESILDWPTRFPQVAHLSMAA